MAKTEYDIPAFREYGETPALKEGTMAHSSPFIAKPEHQTDLGFPGELVDDWERKAVDKLGELLKNTGPCRFIWTPASNAAPVRTSATTTSVRKTRKTCR